MDTPRTTPFTWLDQRPQTMAQAVLAWNETRNVRALEAWLLGGHRKVGDIAVLTPERMESFVQGVMQCSDESVRAYSPPLEWPTESIVQTQPIRDALMRVPAWSTSVYEEDENGGSFAKLASHACLYPDANVQSLLASGSYGPLTESTRLWLGFDLNPVWWEKLPFWSHEQHEQYKGSLDWERLMQSVLERPHPNQGVHLALLLEPVRLVQRAQRELGYGPSIYEEPTVADILASSIQDKMALVFYAAIACPRDKLPNPSWWKTWDAWCQAEPEQAQLAITTVLLARLTSVGSGGNHLRSMLVRAASLRDPPPNFGIAYTRQEQKKYEGWSVDELLEHALPVNDRTVHLFDGLASYEDQLTLQYMQMKEKTRPGPGFDDAPLGNDLFGQL